MNNTINGYRSYNKSNPSFGNITNEAKKFITPETIEHLVTKGEMSLKDVAFLEEQPLKIDVSHGNTSDAHWDSIEGIGLILRAPFDESEKIILTPLASGFFQIKAKFKGIGATLGEALKKALKITKKVDIIAEKKRLYLEINGFKIEALKAQETKLAEKLRKETQDILNGESKTTVKDLNELEKRLKTVKKELAGFHNEDYYTDKIKRIFDWS